MDIDHIDEGEKALLDGSQLSGAYTSASLGAIVFVIESRFFISVIGCGV